MIDAGSDGICILANFSEQFVLSDEERTVLMHAALEHVARRVPVIVTTTHFSSRICAERSRAAQDAGAAMVMVMPPYHGATFRVAERGIYEFFQVVSDAISIPVMIQDAPVSGTQLSAPFLARMAKEIANVSYFKIEVPQAASKLRELIALGGDAIVGPWDGEEAITLMADLDAGATGAMTGGGFPDGIRQIMDAYAAGDAELAARHYERWLPLINYENRQGGLASAKVLMKEGGVIRSDAVRHPLPQVHPATREGLIRIARRLEPLVLSWGR
jgi:4-hydroxy-tetrahydrodipicolinate synthase